MIVIPAIDLYGGKVVRLHQGRFDERTEYGDEPYDIAQKFFDMGSRFLHIVDLEAAEVGYPKHLYLLSKIANRLDMKVQFGGGLRTKAAIKDAQRAGATRLMVGSIMFKKPDSPQELFDEFGELLTPSVDVRHDKVVVSGWKKETDVDPADMIRDLRAIGYDTFLVTAVEHDGTLEGPDFSLYSRLAGTDAFLIAAGGVTTVDNVKKLSELGVRAAVVGKAMYEGQFDFKEAMRVLHRGE